MIEDDTNTSFSTEESVDEVVKPTQAKTRTRNKRPQKTGLKKVSKEFFKTKVNNHNPKTIIKQVKGEKSKPKQSVLSKGPKSAPKKGKNTSEKKTPIGVFTKTILEALYDLNKAQKWTT